MHGADGGECRRLPQNRRTVGKDRPEVPVGRDGGLRPASRQEAPSVRMGNPSATPTRASHNREVTLRQDLERAVLKNEKETRKSADLLRFIFSQKRSARTQDHQSDRSQVITPLEELTGKFELIVEELWFGEDQDDRRCADGGQRPRFRRDPIMFCEPCNADLRCSRPPHRWPSSGTFAWESMPARWSRGSSVEKNRYDVWGKTVNTASQIESAAPPGSVAVSHAAWTEW